VVAAVAVVVVVVVCLFGSSEELLFSSLLPLPPVVVVVVVGITPPDVVPVVAVNVEFCDKDVVDEVRELAQALKENTRSIMAQINTGLCDGEVL